MPICSRMTKTNHSPKITHYPLFSHHNHCAQMNTLIFIYFIIVPVTIFRLQNTCLHILFFVVFFSGYHNNIEHQPNVLGKLYYCQLVVTVSKLTIKFLVQINILLRMKSMVLLCQDNRHNP